MSLLFIFHKRNKYPYCVLKFVPRQHGTIRTPYSPYFVLGKSAVPRAEIRTSPARYSSYPVLSVPRSGKSYRTPYFNPCSLGTKLFVPRTSRTPYEEYESTVLEQMFSYEHPCPECRLTFKIVFLSKRINKNFI